MLIENTFNAAELIPYRNFKEKIKIVKEQQRKNRYVEIWDKVIYTATKYSELEEMRDGS